MGFQLIACFLLLAFYGCYFAKTFYLSKKGIQVNHLGRDKTGFPKWIEILTRAFSILVPVLELIHIGFNRSALPFPLRCGGVVLGFLGTAVFLCAAWTLQDSWRAGVSPSEKTHLVTDGIYGYSRNPAFLGFDLTYIGILLMFFSPLLCAASAIAILLFHLQIVNVEEDHLIVAFGQPYLDYRRRVSRYFGRRQS